MLELPPPKPPGRQFGGVGADDYSTAVGCWMSFSRFGLDYAKFRDDSRIGHFFAKFARENPKVLDFDFRLDAVSTPYTPPVPPGETQETWDQKLKAEREFRHAPEFMKRAR